MTKKTAGQRPHESADSRSLFLQLDESILKLRKEKEDRVRQVMMETEKGFREIRGQALARIEKHEKARMNERAECVSRLIEVVEKRQTLEERMREVAHRMGVATRELEEMILAGYEGRAKDAKEACDKLAKGVKLQVPEEEKGISKLAQRLAA